MNEKIDILSFAQWQAKRDLACVQSLLDMHQPSRLLTPPLRVSTTSLFFTVIWKVKCCTGVLNRMLNYRFLTNRASLPWIFNSAVFTNVTDNDTNHYHHKRCRGAHPCPSTASRRVIIHGLQGYALMLENEMRLRAASARRKRERQTPPRGRRGRSKSPFRRNAGYSASPVCRNRDSTQQVDAALQALQRLQ